MSRTSVMILGLEPSLIDFSRPAYAGHPGLDADKVRAGLEADKAHLNGLGYDAELCLTDFGDTAEEVVRRRLQQKAFDCVVIGAGLRLIEENTGIFEKLINVVHAQAPHAKLCFNTRPTDTAEAVERWFPSASR